MLPNRRLRLPGVGDVPVRWSRELPSEPSSVTVTVDAAGRYHASFVVEVPDAPLPAVEAEVGIDLGLTHFAVLSDSRKVDNPRHGRKAAVEDLAVSGLARTRLARSVHDAGWSTFVAMVGYKARRHGHRSAPGGPVAALDPGVLGVRDGR